MNASAMTTGRVDISENRGVDEEGVNPRTMARYKMNVYGILIVF